MRKYIQKQVLGIIISIIEAVDYIEQNICQGDINYIIGDCYESIVIIDDTFSKELSESRYTEYKELFEYIKKLFELLSNSIEIEDVHRIILALKDNLELFQNEMRQEAEVKLEIAFLPYKASMWDSLASIWEEAKEDKRCECYVVPIPYYDNSKGNFKSFNYEGEIFPKEVPIIHYNSYSIEQRKPDIIYIHNPYDQFNYVTSIDPRFYSYELKKHTENLVYVPYFVAGSYMTEESARGSGLASGVKNSDWIIAQSYEHKKIFTQLGYDYDRVLALGNPKFDATLKINASYYVIPEEWREKFKGKKVFLYNSSIEHLLQNKKYFDELEENLKYIRENDSCGLIWRPHPLLETTILSMRGDLHEKYLDIKKELLECENTVIDENPDVYPAIQISDALISDYSSIMFQYGITQKPILNLDREYGQYINKGYKFLAINYFSYYFVKGWKMNPNIQYDYGTIASPEGTSIEEFIALVIENNDFKKEQRMKELANSLINIDGNCGKEIHNSLMRSVLSRI